MTTGYFLASCVVVGLFCVIGLASYNGWGLTSDAQAMAQARARYGSVRGGSLHQRRFYGGGPGFGK